MSPHAHAPIIRLADYTPPAYLVETVSLTFKLAPNATRVLSRIRFVPNPASSGAFFLNGENMRLISAAIDGVAVAPEITAQGLTCPVPAGAFTWEAEVEIDPQSNTALNGLYMSNGMFCSQCEAEGFRQITYYPDRPDVMAVFDVRVEGTLPVLLSNGNLTDSGKTEAGVNWAQWHDPWPKPSYLFALVAGDLVAVSDAFTTKSGRDVALNIYVRSGDAQSCAYAMEVLKRSMRWDEETYGREYDLDIFNIVAVDDFNMGAMENKGLNIFNSRAVLASPDTATDVEYARIETIIAHEYFHNWTGNRITCRDWFQLSLKEGLTVFRDRQFTGDMRSVSVKRIEDAIALRAGQFKEDSGPLSHPVRPESFVEINNFYTDTIYRKGAEVIGMLKRLVGDANYAKALDHYFDANDGKAATIEDWLSAFEAVTGRDLSQFKRWYEQAGTPRLSVAESWDDGTFTLHFEQSLPQPAGQEPAKPMVLPIAVGLIGPHGNEVLPTQILEMTEAKQSFTFTDLAARPVASILRGFSAPLILEQESNSAKQAFLLQHDTDPFNKWEAGQALARASLRARASGGNDDSERAYLAALGDVLRDQNLDPAFRGLMLALPSEDELAQAIADAGSAPDPAVLHQAKAGLRAAIAAQHGPLLVDIYQQNQITGPYSPAADDASKRALTNAALALIALNDTGVIAENQYANASNMTDQLGALSALLRAGLGQQQLAAFEQQWQHDPLVMNKWFSLQAQFAAPEKAANVAQALVKHQGFTASNPNNLRAVLGALSANHAGFHYDDGASYAFLADWLIRTDKINPQIAARLSGGFAQWRRYDAARQALMTAQLERMGTQPGLSRNLGEMIARMLG